MSDKHELGDAPVEARYRQQMEAIARTLDEFLNPGLKGQDRTIGFVLLIYEFGNAPGRCNFISNGADRRDVATLFKEMIARFEGQSEPPTGHA